MALARELEKRYNIDQAEMGFEKNRFFRFDELDEFVCGICLGILNNPLVTECCGQTYCSFCTKRWLSDANTCPYDRKQMSVSSLKEPSKAFRNLWLSLKIECNFKEEGCKVQIKLSELDHHIKICEYMPTTLCTSGGIYREKVSNHNCVQTLFNTITGLKKEKLQLKIDYEEKLKTKINALINAMEYSRKELNEHKQQKSKDDIELKNIHGNYLVTNFYNAHISSAQRNGSSAKIIFSRDPTAQHFYGLVNEVKNDQKISHYSLQWVNSLPNEEFCVHISGDQHWYATYEESTQRWPIDKKVEFKERQPFITYDFFQDPYIGSVMEYLFLGSKGFGLFIERSAPLFMRRDYNNGNPLLCFSGDYHKSPYNHALDTKETKIVFHLLSATDIMHVFRYANNLWIPKPTAIPDQRMIKYPVWSTWVKYKDPINQEKVLDFAKQITSHGFPNSQLEIDETWEVKFGDQAFDTKKFPNPKQMISTLKSQGYRTTIWVNPFINKDCDVVHKQSQYLVRAANGSVIFHKWWNGMAAHVDFTNKEAREWYVSRLQHLRNSTGIDGFKFDGGELGYVNTDFQFHNRSVQQTPLLMSKLYVETAARLGNFIETRTAYNTQHLPTFVRMLDKNSIWGYDNGLKTLIPTALTMSIAGYPFVLPDMIGGNAYNGQFPSKEMYIRWLQVNTLMPALQFSITPWDINNSTEEVINITKSMVKLHEKYSPLIISLAQNAVKTGEPIMRPLWWLAPNDPNSFTVDDQFLVGNDLLVAPITTDNSRERDIYLPTGEWVDHRGVAHKGPQTLKGFKVELHELPYFTRK